MTRFINTFRRLCRWLAEPERRPEPTAPARDWADLPVYHPCTE